MGSFTPEQSLSLAAARARSGEKLGRDLLQPFHQPSAGPPVSLRLGHAPALTVHRTVIHYRSAALLPFSGG